MTHLFDQSQFWMLIHFWLILTIIVLVAANCWVIKQWLITRAKTQAILKEIEALEAYGTN